MVSRHRAVRILTVVFAGITSGRYIFLSSVGNACVRKIRSLLHTPAMVLPLLPAAVGSLRQIGISDLESEAGAGDDSIHRLDQVGQHLISILDSALLGEEEVAVKAVLTTLEEETMKDDANRTESDGNKNEHSMFFDGMTGTPVKTVLLGGPPADIIYKFPLDPSGITLLDAQHFLIPLRKHVFGSYRQSHLTTNSVEYGTVRLLKTTTPLSVFGDEYKYGMVVKHHVTKHEGEWDTSDEEHVHEEVKNRTALENKHARELLKSRMRWLMAYLAMSNLGAQSVKNFLDVDRVKKLKEFTDAHNGAVDPKTAAMLQKAIDELDLATIPVQNVVGTRLGCLHMAGNDLSHVRGGNVKVPLDKAIISQVGQTFLSPSQHLVFFGGAMYFSLSLDKKSLLMYYKAFTMFDMPFRSATGNFLQPSYFVSPVNGEAWGDGEKDIESRQGVRKSSELLGTAISRVQKKFRSLPLDYEYLWESPSHFCDASAMTHLDDEHNRLPMQKFVASMGRHSFWAKAKEIGISFTKAFGLITFLGRSTRCALKYVRSDCRHSHGFNELEGIAWAHFLMEFTGDALVAANTDWDDLEAQL